MSREELELILSTRQDAGSTAKPETLRVAALFSRAISGLMMLQYFGSNFTFFFSLTCSILM